MHSSYALASEDFVVERGGKTLPLSALWPDYTQGLDRLGVLLCNPMDPIGCSNLIGGTNTLFYDGLRDRFGPGGFFRYADTYLFGVGCEPGDWNQLDVWPLHKFVSIMQPTAEAVIETINDRRITLLAIPETGARCRGEVVLSTWNAFLDTVRAIVLYNPRTGRATDSDLGVLGNKVVESYVEQAIFTTPGVGAGEQARYRRVRRQLDREPMRSFETYRTIRGPAAARALLGVTEVLPPGHQELSRRATPTVIMPVEMPLPAIDAASLPTSAALAVNEPAPDPSPATDLLRHTAFDPVQRRLGGSFAEWEGWDWIADFGDPIAEHHAVRESVGVWDESPLRKWEFSGRDALKAADYCFANDMSSLEVGQVRYGAFCDEYGKMLGDGTVYRGRRGQPLLAVTALETDGDHFRSICDGRFTVEITEKTADWPHLQLQGPRSRELLARLTDVDIAGLRYFRFLADVTVGGIDGCIVSRTGYSGELGYEIYCPAGEATALWRAVADEGASFGLRAYGLTAVESLRIESGLIFIGFDYFPGLTSPFHMNLDRTIRLDVHDFHGRDALRSELDAGISHRMATLVVQGEQAPDYGAPVTRHGRGVGKLLSPSAGRSPTVDRVIGMACLEVECSGLGTQVEVALPDGRLVPATVDHYPIYDPEKTRPRS